MTIRFLPRLTAFVVLAMAVALGNQTRAADGPDSRVAADGRSFTISAPGLTVLRAGFAAKVEINGGRRSLDSTSGKVVEAKTATVSSAYGSTRVTTSVIRFEAERLDLLFRLGQVAGMPQVVLVQAGIHNFGQRPVRLAELLPLMMRDAPPSGNVSEAAHFLQVTGKPEEWLLTGLHAKTSVQLILGDMQTEAWIHEQGGIYRKDGTGFLFGPIGDPVSYLSTLFTPQGNGRAGMTLVSAMDKVQVNPGQVRWGQQAGLFFEPPRTAMARWAEWVARTHGSRTAKGALSGWSSVYSPERIARGTDVLGVVAQIGKSDGRLRPDVIQIGENYEVDPGKPMDIADFYPEGFPFYARKISAAGQRAGLKLDFDMSKTDITRCIADVRQAVRDGFSYLKIGYHQPNAFRKTLAGGEKTSLEVFRENFQALREAAGDDTYILFCDWFTDRATLGRVDASRTGPVTTRSGVRDVMRHVLNSYHLNDRWFAVDNDCYYMATELKDVSPVVGGWPLARTWISMVGLSCGAAFTSDTWDQERFNPYWRNVEVLSPPAKERTEVLDIGTAKEWPRLVGQVKRNWGDFTVALLWNPSEKEQSIMLDFAKAGLDPRKRYAVWSFWDNRYLGLAQEFWSTPQQASAASQHLRFTAIPRSSVPVLIGSNLHIYCGAAEIETIRSSSSSMTIALTDAGARAGDLFVYSRYLPVLRSASGLVVTAIDQAGENVWRIRVRDRESSPAQRIELSIDLPVTRQWWFWSMIALMVASMITAAWRYVAWLKLERKHSLAVERSRIARDLHDDLGANLAEIAMISDLAQEQLPEDDPSRQSLNEIFTRAETNARRLGEIVWAINPANDTLERFAGFLCKFTQDYLALARVGCRLEVPEQLPPLPLNSIQRHHLFLAAKEAIHNAVRHGKPTEITLRLSNRVDRISIIIEDNGCGFDSSQQAASVRGTHNMRERMEKIGGTFTCHSAPGQGATVTLSAPLKS